ncbi:hypothetical protein KGQ55_04035, partial [Patescibacteria group bacterium]|nr:hypothetical protein [Patescibacteria group bacterium]
MKAKETLLARLRFEREARRAFLPRFGHGRYADAWTLLHVFSGVTLGLGCLLLHIRPYPALFIVLVLAFAYEAMEAFIGIAEDIENSLTDVAAAACGAIL